MRGLFIFLALGSFLLADQFYISGYERSLCPNDPPRPPKPLMWTATTKVDKAFILGFEHELYKTKYLEFHSGISGGQVELLREEADSLWVGSIYLMGHLNLYKSKNLKLYVLYSPAGPSILSQNTLGPTAFSNRFVFQDQFGVGLFLNTDAKMHIFAKFYHFSNGDLFPVNGGFDIPIQLGLSFRI